MDFSRLNRRRVAIGAIASAALLLSLLFLPWYSLEHIVSREPGTSSYNPEAFVCGEGEFSCTGFETFPILRWLLIGAALAPLILAWILVRGHRLSWAPGELTMVVGFAATVLILYNGIIDKPGSGPAETSIGLDIGYWVALVAAIMLSWTGWTRSLESGARKQRKAPGTV